MLRAIRYKSLARPWRLLSRSVTETYITRHFEPDPAELKRVLQSLNSEYEITKDGCINVKDCNLCGKPRDPNKTNKLRIFADGGYNCYRCAEEPHGHGNWLKLKRTVLGSKNIPEVTRPTQTLKSDFREAVPKTIPLFGHPQDSREVKNAREVLDYLNKERGLNNMVIMKYGVGMAHEKFLADSVKGSKDRVWVDHLCVTFPWMKPSPENPDIFENVRMKFRYATRMTCAVCFLFYIQLT